MTLRELTEAWSNALEDLKRAGSSLQIAQSEFDDALDRLEEIAATEPDPDDDPAVIAFLKRAHSVDFSVDSGDENDTEAFVEDCQSVTASKATTEEKAA